MEWTRQPGIDKLEGKTLPKLIRLKYLGSYRIAQDPISHLVDFIRYTQARLDMAIKNFDNALAIIHRELEGTERKVRIVHTARLLLLKSLILDKQNQSEGAINAFLSLVRLVDINEFIQIL